MKIYKESMLFTLNTRESVIGSIAIETKSIVIDLPDLLKDSLQLTPSKSQLDDLCYFFSNSSMSFSKCTFLSSGPTHPDLLTVFSLYRVQGRLEVHISVDIRYGMHFETNVSPALTSYLVEFARKSC